MPPRVKFFHPEVDYGKLHEREKSLKISRDLYTVFYLNRETTLTDTEIFFEFKRLGIAGYESSKPECIIRGNICKWNDMAAKLQNGCKVCEASGCGRTAIAGEGKPQWCKFHSAGKQATLAVDMRIIKNVKEKGEKKSRYGMTTEFYRHVFGQPPRQSISTVMSLVPCSSPNTKSLRKSSSSKELGVVKTPRRGRRRRLTNRKRTSSPEETPPPPPPPKTPPPDQAVIDDISDPSGTRCSRETMTMSDITILFRSETLTIEEIIRWTFT